MPISISGNDQSFPGEGDIVEGGAPGPGVSVGRRAGSATGHGSCRRSPGGCRSTGAEVAGRAGLAARGVVYCLLGALPFALAVGDRGGEQTDQRGALAELAERPWGKPALVVLVVGFAAYALWRLVRAVRGEGGEEPEAGLSACSTWPRRRSTSAWRCRPIGSSVATKAPPAASRRPSRGSPHASWPSTPGVAGPSVWPASPSSSSAPGRSAEASPEVPQAPRGVDRRQPPRRSSPLGVVGHVARGVVIGMIGWLVRPGRGPTSTRRSPSGSTPPCARSPPRRTGRSSLGAVAARARRLRPLLLRRGPLPTRCSDGGRLTTTLAPWERPLPVPRAADERAGYPEKFAKGGLTFDDVLLVPAESNVLPQPGVDGDAPHAPASSWPSRSSRRRWTPSPRPASPSPWPGPAASASSTATCRSPTRWPRSTGSSAASPG